MLLVSEKWNPFINVGEIHFQIVPNCYLIDCCFEMKRQPRLLVRLATARRQSVFLPPERQRQYHAFYSWPIWEIWIMQPFGDSDWWKLALHPIRDVFTFGVWCVTCWTSRLLWVNLYSYCVRKNNTCDRILHYLQWSYPSEYKRDIRIEFIIISIEVTVSYSCVAAVILLTRSPLHAASFRRFLFFLPSSSHPFLSQACTFHLKRPPASHNPSAGKTGVIRILFLIKAFKSVKNCACIKMRNKNLPTNWVWLHVQFRSYFTNGSRG